jgi:hypothetical protein
LAFNSSNIFFKYIGYQVVQNSSLSNFLDYQVTLVPLQYSGNAPNDISQYKRNDAMNLIFLDHFINPLNPEPNTSNELAFLGYNLSAFQLGLLNDPKLEQIIVHKMGHNLGLYHTYETGSHFLPYSPLFAITDCERITRNLSNPTFNADIAGDEVIDTPAQPQVSDSYFNNNCGSYIFDPSRINCYNEPYQNIDNIDINKGNWMNRIDQTTACNHYFTLGQTKKMREFIKNDVFTGFYQNPYFNGSILPTRNTVESLYQPYKTEIIAGTEVVQSPPPTDLGNGTAYVCRNQIYSQTFQRGFDYIFPDNLSPDITFASVNINPTVKFNTADYPVTIIQLAPGQTNLTSNTGYAKLNCTRGVICQVEAYKQGVKYSTEVLGSMNITLEELNEIQIKDPNLYNNLMSHYYYIIEKQTETGVITRETFYKQ